MCENLLELDCMSVSVKWAVLKGLLVLMGLRGVVTVVTVVAVVVVAVDVVGNKIEK